MKYKCPYCGEIITRSGKEDSSGYFAKMTEYRLQLSASQKKVEELERALRIESSEPEERSQESAHYIWLDDKNEELEKRVEELEKELENGRK